ncbi:hypothetical protein CO657_01060 [Rhizobium acidisoli]|uniref:Lytic murein transglycosylase n=1 Tax=Rhizobium acidisoli TaxID=1538158 RepID=A0AAE5WMV3_9HYPH|nr:hypothetical protein CO657_01060 [Rhizobium acidisoli]
MPCGTPLCPAGHLPHKEGDRQKVGSPVPLRCRAEHQFVIAWGNHRALPISPPEGEMPGRAEGAFTAHP